MDPGHAPVISVVMPAYNCRRFIEQAVDSILRQTVSDFEFLIYDDGSTDGTTALLQAAARRDGRIRLFRGQHQGYSPLLNQGLARARGEFIARMDADDISFPMRFQKQLEYLRSNPRCAAVGSGLVFIDEDGLPFSRNQGPTDHADIDAKHLRGGGGAMPHPSLMMRKSEIDAIGGYRTQFEPAEDLDLLLRLAERGNLANLPECLLAYRVHLGMTSIAKREKQLAAVRQILAETGQRRGIALEYHPGPSNSASPEDLWFKRRTQAFDAGYFKSARVYSLRLCLARPWDLRRWSWWLRTTYLSIRHGPARSAVA